MGKKNKKEKITYIDDGSAVADMSDVRQGPRLSDRSGYRPRASLKEQWKTYCAAVKMMFVPMLVFLCGITIIYMIVYTLFLFAGAAG